MLTDILCLSDHQMERLLAAFSQGTIGPGTDATRLRKVGLHDHAEIISEWLYQALGTFGSIDGVTAAIRLLQAQRCRSKQDDPRPELILSGPGTEETSSRDTRVVVREIFESVKRSVLIVGYAFYGSDRIFEPLARRMGMDPDLKVRFIVNIHPATSQSAEETIGKYARDFLRLSWPFHPRPTVYYLSGSLEARADRRSSVHAKLIVADQEAAYLGSANFTTAAFQRNIEAGLRLTSETLCHQLTAHFERMILSGLVVPLPVD